jgi:hypothetical protein
VSSNKRRSRKAETETTGNPNVNAEQIVRSVIQIGIATGLPVGASHISQAPLLRRIPRNTARVDPNKSLHG